MIVASAFEDLDERQRLAEMNRIIAAWREPRLVRVRPARVVPDTTNRDGTGLSANHLHYIATSMQTSGFTPRDHMTASGHDLPVFVGPEKVGESSTLGADSLAKWRHAQEDSMHELPAVQEWATQSGEAFYCSLGNGHFFQALNLFGSAARCKFRDEPPAGSEPAEWPEVYTTAGDVPLHAAVHEGVEGVVLRPQISKSERKFVSQMLNAAYEYRWIVDAKTGEAHIDTDTTVREFTSFDGLVKHADSWQLDELVELHMKKEVKNRKKKQAEAAIAQASL